MVRNLRKEAMELLGYSTRERVVMEGTEDDVLDAYREMLDITQSAEAMEDVVDAVTNFLDVVSSLDDEGEVERRFVGSMRMFAASDELKDQVKAMVGLMGEWRNHQGLRSLKESVENAVAAHDSAVAHLKLSRGWDEAAMEIGKYLATLSDMNPDIAAGVRGQLLDALLALMQDGKFVGMVKSLAKHAED